MHPIEAQEGYSRRQPGAGSGIVIVVDDDDGIRESLCGFLTSLGLRTLAFRSAAEYFAFPRPDMPGCLILDLELPDTNGLDLQEQIADEGHPPIVFISGRGDIAASVRAIKSGAVDFLTKPVGAEELAGAVYAAINRDCRLRQERAQQAELQQRLERLTPREREVLPLIVSGLLNKQAAAQLGISEITYQIHRSKVMRKMQALSLADLVRMSERLQIPIVQSRVMLQPWPQMPRTRAQRY